MHQTIRSEKDPGKFLKVVIPNMRCIFVESDHRHNLKSRKLVSSVMAEICGVLVNWCMGKQTCITAH